MCILASDDKSFPRYWFLTIDDDVGMNAAEKEDMALFIEQVLVHENGWSSHGYTFIRISEYDGMKSRLETVNKKYIIHIRLSKPETIGRKCGFKHLSCADLTQNIIYLNYNRWMKGSKQSGLSLMAYRIYVICHEVGHLLNRRHHGCQQKHSKCPVMYQQTISTGCCKPHQWPLSWE